MLKAPHLGRPQVREVRAEVRELVRRLLLEGVDGLELLAHFLLLPHELLLHDRLTPQRFFSFLAFF